ncbi:hypothetical protein J6590_089197 [Homalodisca vitripennis]|nr:hypothetical protein J6590_089197 [Homalodisca vitripennis]
MGKSGRPNTSEEAALGNEEVVTEGQGLPAPVSFRGNIFLLKEDEKATIQVNLQDDLDKY